MPKRRYNDDFNFGKEEQKKENRIIMAWHQANYTTAKLDATSFRSGNVWFGIEEVQYQKITSVNFSMLLSMYLNRFILL